MPEMGWPHTHMQQLRIWRDISVVEVPHEEQEAPTRCQTLQPPVPVLEKGPHQTSNCENQWGFVQLGEMVGRRKRMHLLKGLHTKSCSKALTLGSSRAMADTESTGVIQEETELCGFRVRDVFPCTQQEPAFLCRAFFTHSQIFICFSLIKLYWFHLMTT